MATNRFKAKLGLDNNQQTITNVADPVNAQDAATRAYVLANAGSGGTAYVRTSNTATAGQTIFPAVYTGSLIEVFLNGVLLNAADYTASNGTTVVLASAALVNDLVETIAYGTTLVGITTASGGLNSLQYNHNGVMDGTTTLTLDTDGLLVLESSGTATPIKPTAGVKLFGRSVANRMLPAFIGPGGLESTVQPFLGRSKIATLSGLTNSTALSAYGLSISPVGAAAAATWGVTSLAASMNRLEYRLANASASGVAGIRGTTQNNFIASGALVGTQLGGFTFVCRWSLGQPVIAPSLGTCRAFVGLRGGTIGTPTDLPISGIINQIGMGWDAAAPSSDVNLQIYCSGTTTSKIDTGIVVNKVVTSAANAQAFELVMFALPGTNAVNFMVTELGTNNIFQTTVSTAANLPITTATLNTALAFYGYVSSGGTSTTLGFALCSLYIETDY